MEDFRDWFPSLDLIKNIKFLKKKNYPKNLILILIKSIFYALSIQ